MKVKDLIALENKIQSFINSNDELEEIEFVSVEIIEDIMQRKEFQVSYCKYLNGWILEREYFKPNENNLFIGFRINIYNGVVQMYKVD
jgi:hypothetical protein